MIFFNDELSIHKDTLFSLKTVCSLVPFLGNISFMVCWLRSGTFIVQLLMGSISLFYGIFRSLNKPNKTFKCPRNVSIPDCSFFHELDWCVNLGIKLKKKKIGLRKELQHVRVPQKHLYNLVSIVLKTHLRKHACLGLSFKKGLFGASCIEDAFILNITFASVWKGLRVLSTACAFYSEH